MGNMKWSGVRQGWWQTAVGLLLLFGALLTVEAAPLHITILHTNDFHQALEPLPRIAGYVREYRKENPDTVFVDAGDWFDRGSSLATITRGEAIYGAMARMGYDMTILGNHDWAYGNARLLELIGAHKLPVLGTNLGTLREPFPPQIKPTIVREFGGIRVGFIGITLDTYSKNPKARPQIHATECHAATRKGIAMLQAEKCHIIVAVTHLGFKKMKHETRSTHPSDIDLAKAFPDIDVIVGAHSHTLLSEQATRDTHAETGVIVVQSGASGHHIGQLTLLVDPENGRIESFETTQVSVASTMPEHEDVSGFLREMYSQHMPNAKTVVGNLETNIAFHNLAYWYADFLRETTGADLVLLPRKTLYDEPRTIGKGPMTVERMRGYFYDCYLFKSTVKGAELLAYCTAENRRDRFNPHHHQGRPFSGDATFLSGMSAVFNPETQSVDFDLEPEKMYELVTPWPFTRKDIYRNRHRLPSRDVAAAAEPIPGLKILSKELLDQSAVELLIEKGMQSGLSFTPPFPEPRADWAPWIEHFEAKLKPGTWRLPR